MIMQFTSRHSCKYTQFILPVTFKTSLFTDTVRGNKCLDTFVANCSFETFAIKWVFAALWFSFGPLLLANFLQFSSYEGLFDRLVISKSSFNKVRRLIRVQTMPEPPPFFLESSFELGCLDVWDCCFVEMSIFPPRYSVLADDLQFSSNMYQYITLHVPFDDMSCPITVCREAATYLKYFIVHIYKYEAKRHT